MLISANELKRRGISFIGSLMKDHYEIYVSVRGKKKFVILPVEEYERLREAELESIIKRVEKDYEEGRYTAESAEEHFKRVGI